MELCLQTGWRLSEAMRLREAELNLWAAYRARHGLPIDRQVMGTANGAAYLGATWGGKASVGDLVPKFRQPADAKGDRAAVVAWFKGLAKKKG